MRVRFTMDYDWYPPETGRQSHIAYKAGMEMLVRRQCALDAIAAGVAEKLPSKEKDNAA
jgi:hypothetical protein